MGATLVEQAGLPTKLLHSLQEIGSWRKLHNVHSAVFANRSTSSKVKCEQTYTHIDSMVIFESYICLFFRTQAKPDMDLEVLDARNFTGSI